MINFYNQANMVTKSVSFDSFPNTFQMFNSAKQLDPRGCMAATMMFYAENGTVHYIGGSAPRLTPPVWYCQGHFGDILDLKTLNASRKHLRMVLRANDLDTMPSIVRYKGEYYKYTRWNIKSRHIRQVKLYRSTELYDNQARTGVVLVMPYQIYMANIFVIEETGVFHGFFWCYNKNFKFSYDSMFVVYATSKDGVDFSHNVQTLFKGRRFLMPVNGHIRKNGECFVYFLDYSSDNSFVFMIALSALQPASI